MGFGCLYEMCLFCAADLSNTLLIKNISGIRFAKMNYVEVLIIVRYLLVRHGRKFEFMRCGNNGCCDNNTRDGIKQRFPKQSMRFYVSGLRLNTVLTDGSNDDSGYRYHSLTVKNNIKRES